ncbi:MAG: FAD-dependent oxidoreductase [bacterium]|nr:FAD-dependent oxidoreductase [bacterium]
MKYLIIGNSAGALGAVEGIRRLDKAGTITVLGEEPYRAYSRPMITRLLKGEADVDGIAMRSPDYYRSMGVELVTGVAAESLDLDANRVSATDGKSYDWDRLLLACGSKPLVPPVPGLADLPYVTFLTADDALAIRERVVNGGCRRIGVIGGGLIGLSLAEALMDMGAEPLIFEQMPRILPSIISDGVAGRLAGMLVDRGLAIYAGSGVAAVEKTGAGYVIRLNDGSMHEVDLVAVAAGVRPRTELVSAILPEGARYLPVDAGMATGQEGIYACGDMVSLPEQLSGTSKPIPTWPNAYMGGRTAGYNMAGGKADIRVALPFNAFHYFNIALATAGCSVAVNGDETVVWDNGAYREVMLRDGRISGFAALGDIDNGGLLSWLMRRGADVSACGAEIAAPDFSHLSLSPELRRELEETVKEGQNEGSGSY